MSFLPKILGRNQDFAIGLAWGELTFKKCLGINRWEDGRNGRNEKFFILPGGNSDFWPKINFITHYLKKFAFHKNPKPYFWNKGEDDAKMYTFLIKNNKKNFIPEKVSTFGATGWFHSCFIHSLNLNYWKIRLYPRIKRKWAIFGKITVNQCSGYPKNLSRWLILIEARDLKFPCHPSFCLFRR